MEEDTLKFHNPMADVLMGAFREWGPASHNYKKTFKKMTDQGFSLAYNALCEIDIMAPGPLWTWYTRNHMRFYQMRNEDVRITIELLQYFLADYAHGRLKRENEILEAKKSGQETDRSKRTNPTYRLQVNSIAKKSSH